MTRVQKIQLKQSELRTKIAEELDKTEDERTDGLLEDLTSQARATEVELRAALTIEEETATPDVVESQEDHQLRELRERLDFGAYVNAALSGTGVMVGAEAEYNTEIGLPPNQFPLDILAGQGVETRAKLDGDAANRQESWLDRVMAGTAAANLGISMRSIEPGVHTVPLTTGGGAPAQRGRTEDATVSAFTFALTELKPTRASIYMEYSSEDALRVPGLADAIERDMQAAMTEGIDRKIFLGDAGANENNADITGLNTASITEVKINQTNKVKAEEVLKVFLGLVDGKYANGIEGLNVVTSVGANQLWGGTVANSTAENQTIAGFLRANGLSWTTRGEIETATAANDFGAFIGLPMGIAGAAVAGVWRGAELIRDPYTKATSAETRLVMHYFWDFKIARADNFRRLKFVAD